jgi:hypothetical protein
VQADRGGDEDAGVGLPARPRETDSRAAKDAAASSCLVDGLTFEFTGNARLRQDYLAIYEREFRLSHDAPDYRSIEDEHELRARTCVVRAGGRCVGGARLSITTAEEPHPLPIEMDRFRLADYFPRLRASGARYGQVGRMCLLPEFRGGQITRRLLACMHQEIVALDLYEIFGTCTPAHARAYKISCITMGLKRVRIYADIALPAYPMCERQPFVLIGGDVEPITHSARHHVASARS